MSVNIAIAQKRGKQMLNRRIDSIAGLKDDWNGYQEYVLQRIAEYNVK